MTTAMPSSIEAAQEYAARGWLVIPLHSIRDGRCTCSKPDTCDSQGKHPRSKNGLTDGTTDRYQIADWWRKWPDANVGIVTGAESGLIVLDIDPRHGGDKSLDAIEANYGKLPATATVCTGGSDGGFHFYFQHPGGTLRSRTDVFPGIDIKADGGYVVAPPSNHASGGVYRFDEGRAPDDI